MAKDEADKARQLLERGAELAGTAVAATAGLLVGEPSSALIAAGTVAAATFGVSCSHAFKDIANRVLSNREQVRIGAVGVLAIDEVRARVAAGESIRNDGFFKEGRSPGAELFEGTLMKARQTHQEKKLPYLAKLFANIVFDSSCSSSEANHVLMAAEQLTYDQLCILNLFADRRRFNLRDQSVHDDQVVAHGRMVQLMQMWDLVQRHWIIECVPDSTDWIGHSAPTSITPAFCALSAEGRRVFDLLGLAAIPLSDVTPIANEL